VTELPRGTVTFLFTDIEGSTRLLRQLGRDAYDELLVAHREIVEAAVAAHEGRVVETQGDSFFVAFGTAADGVGAAIDVQRDLAAYPWPEGAEFKVRMGLHTGEPKVGAERYVGVGVHKAARIGAAGHGGQVLLSSTTKELAEDDLPVGISIRDLGERRLKDFERPERIFQLLIEGLESAFAQLKTLDVELGRRRRRMYAGSALIGVLAAAVAIPIFALGAGSPGRGQVVNGNAVAVIDPWSNRVSDQVPVGAHPQAIALGSGGLWVANLDDGTVSHIDPQTEQPTKAIAIGAPVSGLAPTDAAVWAVSIDPTQGFAILRKIDPRYQVVTKTRRLPASFFGTHAASIVTGTSGLWVGADGGLLTRLNPTTGAFARTVDTNNNPGAVAEGAGAVWIADAWANNVVRVDGTTSLVTATIPVGNSPSSVTVGEGGVWVADTGDDAVVRIDPNDNTPTARIPVGRSPTGIAVGYGAVWVANSQDGTVSRIDPSDNRVSKTITVGGSPQKIAVGDRRVWVTVQRAVPAPSHVGGVVRIDWAGSAIDSLDPGIAFSPTSWEIAYATCAELLNYPDRSAPAESRLEPEIAAAVPAPTNGGKTYTFVVRKGFHFSPPSNEAVTARNFAYAIERALSPRLKSDAKGFLSDVVGFSAYEAGRAKHISGVTASGDKLTIRLTRAAPDFLARITMPFFCPVPLDTPVARNVRTVPGAGPYYVTSYTPDQDVVLKQNPSYRGPRPHAAQEIDLDLGTSGAQAVHEVEAGQADFTQVTPQSMTRLASRYGPKSAAAKAGHQRYFVNTGGPLATNYLALNTSRPLFADTRLRRAVNYALNRRRLARIGGFGSSSEAPTDQLLPPGLPGFHDVHIYPYSPDLKKARRLARGRGGHAVMYTCNDAECHQGAQVIQANLKAIGIDVEVKTFPFRQLFDHLGTRGEPFDIGLIGWVNDYPDPYDFLNLLLSGATIKPTGNSNFSYFDDPTYNHKLAAAARLSGPRRYLAYGKLDAELARDAAPYAALWNYPERDFFSARMGCETYQPVYGVDLAALCIRHR
jgi:YVTN family beta-propeller protein